MKPIKLYGESKTGTSYLRKLLELNVEAEILPDRPGARLGWKHGFPQRGNATYLFIFRNVYAWVRSHLAGDGKDLRFNGLKAKFGDPDGHWRPQWMPWDTMFDCRRAKYYSYIGFARLHDSVLVSYEHLRGNPGCLSVLAGFGYEIAPAPEDVETHIYNKKANGRDNPDRPRLNHKQIAYINEKIDPELEYFVDNLSIHANVKSSHIETEKGAL